MSRGLFISETADLSDILSPEANVCFAIPTTGANAYQLMYYDGAAWQIAIVGAGAGAPTTADYLTGTAQAGLSAEIVVGTAPGGELGGTWASPTVDATHSGSTHAATQAAAEATAAAALASHEADTTSIHGIANTANLALTTGTLAQFAATTSAQLAGVLSDETGSGAAVFATSPTLVTPALGTPSAAVLTNATGLPTAGLVDDAVTYAKIQNISAASKLLGRGSAAGAGDTEEITVGTGLAMTGTTLSATGGTGDVVGPAIAVDNDIVLFDGTTGKLIKDSGVLLSAKQAADATLTALAAYNTNGLIAQTAADTFAGRTITGTANRLSVSNGDGVAGNPTLNVPDSAQLSIAKVVNLTNNGFVKTGSADGTLSVDTAAYITASSSDTLTNKTLDAEGTGNVITLPFKLWLPAAGANGTTAGTIWDLPTTNPAVAAAIQGTNVIQGVLDFADGANELSAQYTWCIPSDWTGAVDVKIKWFTTATSGDVRWKIATIAVADAETNDPAFNTADAVVDTAKGTTNQLNDCSITGITMTGAAAGELLHIKISRDPTHASDTLAATARLVGVELTYRRAM